MTTPSLYDEIAELYHLVYADWEASIRRQAAALNAVFSTRLGQGLLDVLDVSCGIGTQAIGLAEVGHRVTASDVAAAAVARAAREAEQRDLSVDFAVTDMRTCEAWDGRQFDVVLSADNSVPHLLSDGDILTAFRSLLRCTKPDGLVVITVRDYAPGDRKSPQLRPYGVRTTGDGRCIVFQVWNFTSDEIYDVAVYFVLENAAGEVRTVVGRSRYYAVSIDRLLNLLRKAGFADVERLEDAFFQPVLVGRRPAG